MDRKALEIETERLNKEDVANCQERLNETISSLESEFGCIITVQGTFVGDWIKTQLLVTKKK